MMHSEVTSRHKDSDRHDGHWNILVPNIIGLILFESLDVVLRLDGRDQRGPKSESN